MENKLYSMDIDSAEWDGKDLSFNLENLNIDTSKSVCGYKCASSENPMGIFITKTREEEYHVNNSKINNGVISLNLELIDSEKALSPLKGKITLFINNTLSDIINHNTLEFYNEDLFEKQKNVLLSCLII